MRSPHAIEGIVEVPRFTLGIHIVQVLWLSNDFAV
jgi:hypothetical protein